MKLKVSPIALILLIGLLFRLSLYIYSIYSPPAIYDGDSNEYWGLAKNLVKYHVYEVDIDKVFPSDTFRPPVYPSFLAATIWLAGDNPFIPILIQIFLSTFSIWLVYQLALRLGMIKQQALMAASLIACDMYTFIYANTLMSDSLFAFQLLVLCCILLNAFQVFSWKNVLFLSATSAILILTRPIAQFLPILIVILLIVFSRGFPKSRWIRSVGYIFLVLLFISPWVGRNYRRYDFAGISTISAYDLLYYGGAFSLARNEGIDWNKARDQLENELNKNVNPDTATIGEYAGAMQRLGIKTILNHFGTYTYLHIQGIVFTLFDPGRFTVSRVLYGLGHGRGLMEIMATKGIWKGIVGMFQQRTFLVIILIFGLLWQSVLVFSAIVGGVVIWKNLPHRIFWLLLSLIGYFIILPGPFGAARFRVPVVPMLVILAASGLYNLWQRMQKHKSAIRNGFNG